MTQNTQQHDPYDLQRQQIYRLYKNGDANLRAKALDLERDLNRGGVAIGSLIAREVLESFVTNDPKMLALKEQVELLAYNDDPVLIFGPSGTGKSTIAKALHGSRGGKFLQLNCTALTDELIASELFGHVKGSFTGAINDKVGKLQAAAGGTVFLDEIGDMPMSMQTKLLKAVEEKTITPVGSNDEIKITCRFVAATNKLVHNIREDLYWRLSIFSFSISSLRDRPADWLVIANRLDPKFPIEQWLELKGPEYPFSGNVRELISSIKRWKVFGTLTS